MTPTMQLRFVKRSSITGIRLILQQLWVSDLLGGVEEWRDVPVAEDE